MHHNAPEIHDILGTCSCNQIQMVKRVQEGRIPQTSGLVEAILLQPCLFQ